MLLTQLSRDKAVYVLAGKDLQMQHAKRFVRKSRTVHMAISCTFHVHIYYDLVPQSERSKSLRINQYLQAVDQLLLSSSPTAPKLLQKVHALGAACDGPIRTPLST